MFGKKTEKKDKTAASEASPFDSQDIIIHNMPSQSRIAGNFSGTPKPTEGRFGLTPIPQKNNFKTVGLAIILLGIIVIAILVYLSYRFIILPTSNNNAPVSTQPPVSAPKNTNPVAPEETASSIPAPTSTAVIVPVSTPADLASSTNATSSSADINLAAGTDLPPLLDTDGDGLLDGEEAILGTSATSTDTNNNKYSDLVEIQNGFDPAGHGPLSGNVNLATYTNKTYSYSLLYPKVWPVKSLAEDATVVFMTDDQSLIQISIQDNTNKTSIQNWYNDSFPSTPATPDQLISANGWNGIMSGDKQNFYLTDAKHKNIYVISYIPAVADRIAYPNIYMLMIKSLAIK